MIERKEIYEKVKTQLSYEFNCNPDDFFKDENIITKVVLHEKRRKFSNDEFFLQMATFGNNTVISANEKFHPWLREWQKDNRGCSLFEQNHFFELETELRKYGYKMALTHHMFLPKPKIVEIKTDLNIKWLEQKDIAPYSGWRENHGDGRLFC